MPLPLPSTPSFGLGPFGLGPFGGGSTPVPVFPPRPRTLNEALSEGRTIRFRFDLLDSDEVLIDELRGVEPSGKLSWTANQSVKGGGMITVQDTGQVVGWLNKRIRPVMMFDAVNEDGSQIERPLGIYIPTAPVENWTYDQLHWDVELLGKNTILEQAIQNDPNTGSPVTYAVDTGVNIVDRVKTLIHQAGEETPAIEDRPDKFTSYLSWDIGTSKLRIVNDMLSAGGFFSLWVDRNGQYQVTEYQDPDSRAVNYKLLAPFSDEESSLMAPEWTKDQDIYAIPNQFLAISQGTADTPAMTVTASNSDPDSPYSVTNRGRWIPEVAKNVEAASMNALSSYAKQRLRSATSVTGKIDIDHAVLPDLKVNDVVWFDNDAASIHGRCTVATTTIGFGPLPTASSRLHIEPDIEVDIESG